MKHNIAYFPFPVPAPSLTGLPFPTTRDVNADKRYPREWPPLHVCEQNDLVKLLQRYRMFSEVPNKTKEIIKKTTKNDKEDNALFARELSFREFTNKLA